MWTPFSSKPLLSEKDEAFQIETFRWLLTYFGGEDFYNTIQLVLPTEAYFPLTVNSPEEAAKSTFKQVKHYAGLEEWPCILKKQKSDPNIEVGEILLVQGTEHTPHGTFSINKKNKIIITYNPELTSNPTQMVATFAHELAHYLTSTASEPPPGGWENWEFATDIAATFLGFGIFQANSAFNFQQFSSGGTQGWQASRSGYLSEAEHSYALSIFLLLKEISPDIAYPHCDGKIKTLVKKALTDLKGKPYIDELRAI